MVLSKPAEFSHHDGASATFRAASRPSRDRDVAVATANPTMWTYTRRTAEALGADYSMQAIRGVHPELQAKMKAAGKLSREYVSYGLDAPIFGMTEALETLRQKRLLKQQLVAQIY